MRVPSYPRARTYGFNMTPMIDVVFLLIIFFLVSSHLARQETLIPLPLPVAESSEDFADLTAARITIHIDDDGTISLAGRTISQDELRQRLQEAAAGDPDVQVRLRSSRHTPYAQIQPILSHCVDVKIWNVTFAVYRDEGGR